MERPKTLVRIRRTRWPASRSSPSPESSAGDDRPYGAGAPSGAPSRRFHCCVGPRFAWMVRFSFGPGAGCPFVRDASAMTFRAGPPSVSRLPAGGCSASGRSPDAARVRAVRQHARGRRTSRCGFPHRPPEQRRESPRPPPACSTLKTPHESAPLAEQGEGIIRADSRVGINSDMNVNDPRNDSGHSPDRAKRNPGPLTLVPACRFAHAGYLLHWRGSRRSRAQGIQDQTPA
jgi:hypothetical protein